MADLFNSDSDSDIEPASAEARGAVLDQLRRQADEAFARECLRHRSQCVTHTSHT